VGISPKILILLCRWPSLRCRIRPLSIWRNRWPIWLCMLRSSNSLLIKVKNRLLIVRGCSNLLVIFKSLGSELSLIRISCRLQRRRLLMLINKLKLWMRLVTILRLMPVRQLYILVLTFNNKMRLSCWIMYLIWA